MWVQWQSAVASIRRRDDDRVRKLSPKKTSRFLIVEADFKLNAITLLEQGGLDFIVIEPGAEVVHSVAERPWQPLFDPRNKARVERHVALLLPLRRERWLSVSWCPVSDRTHRWVGRLPFAGPGL